MRFGGGSAARDRPIIAVLSFPLGRTRRRSGCAECSRPTAP
jgi:hypothetical protein